MSHPAGSRGQNTSNSRPWHNDGPRVRFRGSEAGPVGLAGEAGALCHGIYVGKVPPPSGAGRRAAPNARNAGISGRDRAGTRPLPDHAEGPTRNSLQRKRTHGPPMLLPASVLPHLCPIDAAGTASMGHRCRSPGPPNRIDGPPMRFGRAAAEPRRSRTRRRAAAEPIAGPRCRARRRAPPPAQPK